MTKQDKQKILEALRLIRQYTPRDCFRYYAESIQHPGQQLLQKASSVPWDIVLHPCRQAINEAILLIEEDRP